MVSHKGFATELPVMQAPAGRCCVPAAPSVEPAAAQRMANIFKTLADPTRIRIVSMLAQYSGQVCVCDIVDSFDLSQPTISHHLRALRDAGIIEAEKHGLWVYYSLKPEAFAAVTGFLTSIGNGVK